MGHVSYQQWIIDKAIGIAYHRRMINRDGAQWIAVRGVVEFIRRRGTK